MALDFPSKITAAKACLWNPGQTSPEVQNRGISAPTKITRILQSSPAPPQKKTLKIGPLTRYFQMVLEYFSKKLRPRTFNTKGNFYHDFA